MASVVLDTVRKIVTVPTKPREDGFTDQINRIYMAKMMLLGAFLVGFNWYTDKIKCVIPKALGMEDGFVSSACWINGIYVYEEIRYHANEMGYYGIPRDINQDGMFDNGVVCATTDISRQKVKGCKPMEKTFFLQYQYMIFLILSMALLYYAPYALFRKNNEDMHSLKKSIEDDTKTEENEKKADAIANKYFNASNKNKRRLNTLGDVIVKVLYVIVNVMAFLISDSVLNGKFKNYGISWTDWSKLKNSMAYDYMGMRHFPKPGNVLFPSYGICEVHEAAQDIRHVVTNSHKFVCEMSQHILYQYAFIIIWFAMVFAIVVSVVGLLTLLVDYVRIVNRYDRIMYVKRRTLRECYYLDFISENNLPLYGEVIKRLEGDRYGGLVNDEKPPAISDPYDL